MGTVHTVRGPIDASELGTTLMHEHVFIRSLEVEANWPTGWERAPQVSKAVDRLAELHDSGIDTIVDLTVVGLGRDIELVQEVAAQIDLHIVVATGLYTYDALPHYFDTRIAAMRPSRTDALDEFFLGDIENGIAGTGVRPGIIKCATDKAGLTRDVERVLRAAARVHRQTGIPISTHTDAPTKRGLDQQRLFTEEGVDLSRVVIGHSGDSTDLGYLQELLRAGSTLGMDRFGIEYFCTTEQRVETVARLCADGWSDHMVLSHDANCHADWFDPELLKANTPNWHFLHISHNVLPALRARGVSEQHIGAMLVDTPRRILEHGPKY